MLTEMEDLLSQEEKSKPSKSLVEVQEQIFHMILRSQQKIGRTFKVQLIDLKKRKLLDISWPTEFDFRCRSGGSMSG